MEFQLGAQFGTGVVVKRGKAIVWTGTHGADDQLTVFVWKYAGFRSARDQHALLMHIRLSYADSVVHVAEAAFHASRVSLPSLMGNQLDRITHLSYSELPTGDPSGVEKEELRVGVAYFFSDDEEELDERSIERASLSPCDEGAVGTLDELEYSAFCCHECIFSKVRAREDLRVYPVPTLLSMCKPGDVLELVASAQAPHWAVFQGEDQVIHLHKGEIRKDSLFDVSGGRRGRIANDRYRFRPLPPDLVVRNASGHLGLSRSDVCWTSSESFAAWCRFGKREFKAGGEAHSAGQRYLLKVHLSESTAHTLVFRSLEDLIRERRRVDASGILEELSLLDAKQ